MSLQVDVRLSVGSFRLEAAFEVPAVAAAVLGPNGAGKSTLVALLAGLALPSEGTVRLKGELLDDPSSGLHVPARKRSVGVMFQDHLLFPALSARDNAAFGLRADGTSAREARAKAEELLRRFGLGHCLDRKPRDLSGGESARVALARAIIRKPDLLLLDEPLAALDVESRASARRLIAEVLSDFGGVALLVTHEPVEALSLCDRMLILEEGRVTHEGPPDAIRRRPRSRYAASLAGLNLVKGRVARLGDRCLVEGAWGRLIVADPVSPDGSPVADGAPVLATIHPRGIALSLDRPDGSPRNVLPGVVLSVDLYGDRARLDLGTSPPLTVEIAGETLTSLGLREGMNVWATVKATEIEVYGV